MLKRFVLIFLLIFTGYIYAESERIVMLEDGTYLSSCRSSMVQRSFDGGLTWESINKGLPEKYIYPFKEREYRELSNIFCHEESGCMVCCGSNFVYFFNPAEGCWRQVPLKAPIKERAYFTSVAMKKSEAGFTILVGTSCDGMFLTSDMGNTWEIFPSNRFYVGAGFYEEISSICPARGDGTYSWYASSLPDNILYGYETNIQRWKPLATPKVVTENPIHAITDISISLRIFSGNDVYECSYDASEWYKYNAIKLPYEKRILTYPEKIRKENASGRTGIYLNYVNGMPGRIEKHIEFLKHHGMNSFVIDLKDDFGKVRYRGQDLTDLLEKAHNAGLYVIGRVVVFKDEQMYRKDNFKYAVRNKSDGRPWENGREYWVDPFCPEVWDYNISLAMEFQAAGVDEIQFDYIRFPTDGKISNIDYTWRYDGMTNSDALESFLKKARGAISVPISVDFYGFNGWNRMEKWNGQNLDMASKYVDAVSPMYYPSHFSPDFHKKGKTYVDWAEYLYEAGTRHAKLIAGYNGCIVRPFVQAFLVGEEKKFEQYKYYEYLRRQIDGLNKEKASGFTLWNSSNRYYMVPEDFTAASEVQP